MVGSSVWPDPSNQPTQDLCGQSVLHLPPVDEETLFVETELWSYTTGLAGPLDIVPEKVSEDLQSDGNAIT